jgi:(p)ppGpp synthase/HD superfamily hydrolase
MERVLDKIRDFADRAHGEQMRKYTPERYIVHPVRVMNALRAYTDKIEVLAAALLHDVLEDTSVTAAEILAFLELRLGTGAAAETLRLVTELTDVYVKSAYPKLNRYTRKRKEQERLATISPDAQTIKYADIIDNCLEIPAHDPGFAPRFLKECRDNLRVLTLGHPGLYQKALDAVQRELDGLRKT